MGVHMTFMPATSQEAYSELGQRCREAKNLTAAQDMMKRCLHKRSRVAWVDGFNWSADFLAVH